MKEIEFRAYLWSDEHTNDQWLNWEDGVISFWGNYLHWKGHKELMQYTGLLDRRGKKMYKGDIVRDYSEAQMGVGEIIFDRGAFAVRWAEETELLWDIGCDYWLEVIGNIWE